MKSMYECEYCGEIFNDYIKCAEHELDHAIRWVDINPDLMKTALFAFPDNKMCEFCIYHTTTRCEKCSRTNYYINFENKCWKGNTRD